MNIFSILTIYVTLIIIPYGYTDKPKPKCKVTYSDNYFCKTDLQCSSVSNTGCWRYPCGPERSCGINFKQLPFNDEERNLILHLHNGYRNRIAAAREFREPGTTDKQRFEEATNMKALSYDLELELLAQCWANFCIYQGWTLFHDRCKKTKKYPDVGQNGFMYAHVTPWADKINFSSHVYLGKAIDTWYLELYKFNYDHIQNFMLDHETSNFTQLIWANTSAVGCGRSQYGNGRVLRLLFFCNYGSAGNVVKYPVYQKGKCCSSCEERYVYYFSDNDPEVLKRRIADDVKRKAAELRKSGHNIPDTYRIQGFRTAILTGCNPQYPCLCGNSKIARDGYFKPAFKIAISSRLNHIYYLYVFVVLKSFAIYLFFW